jgi:hypothetical protein
LGRSHRGLQRNDPGPAASHAGFATALAEYVAVEARNLAPLPASVDHVSAAALSLAWLTAWQALFDHAGLRPGQTVLVHGAREQLATWRPSWPGRPASASWAPGGDGTAPPRWRAARSSSPTLTASASRRWLGRWMSCWTRSAGRYLTVRPPWCGPPECSSRWPCRRRSGRPMAAATYFVVEPNGGEPAELARRVQQGRLAPPAGAVRPLAETREAFPGKQGTPARPS